MSGPYLRDCDKCVGYGQVNVDWSDTDERQYRDCTRCKGTGFLPTEEGRAILQLIAWVNGTVRRRT